MGLIELVLTVCTLASPDRCEEQHLHFAAEMSLNQCAMNAQPYIAQWIAEHSAAAGAALRAPLRRLAGDMAVLGKGEVFCVGA